MKALIIEDNPSHYKTFKDGIELAKSEFEIAQLETKQLVADIIEKNALAHIPTDIDLFIFDVSLGNGQDEFGLELFARMLEEYNHPFNYIVVSVWDRSEFKTNVKIEDSNFINKNNYQGFELKLKTRNVVNNLFKL